MLLSVLLPTYGLALTTAELAVVSKPISCAMQLQQCDDRLRGRAVVLLHELSCAGTATATTAELISIRAA
jgi:hypothetical protein